MTAGPSEPDLRYGDSGEAVLWLQQRLRALGLLLAAPGGRFDDETASALQSLGTAHGLTVDPHWVDAQVWAAVAAAEAVGGLRSGSSDAWHWDGESWQPAPSIADAAPAGELKPVDASGQWVWDGTTWQPVT